MESPQGFQQGTDGELCVPVQFSKKKDLFCLDRSNTDQIVKEC